MKQATRPLFNSTVPLVSIGTFQKVTGPKTDLWLVKTVGILITVIGAVITAAGLRHEITREIKSRAVGSAAGLAGIDTIYATRGRIAPIYLADAVAELRFVLVWLFVRTSRLERRRVFRRIFA